MPDYFINRNLVLVRLVGKSIFLLRLINVMQRIPLTISQFTWSINLLRILVSQRWRLLITLFLTALASSWRITEWVIRIVVWLYKNKKYLQLLSLSMIVKSVRQKYLLLLSTSLTTESCISISWVLNDVYILASSHWGLLRSLWTRSFWSSCLFVSFSRSLPNLWIFLGLYLYSVLFTSVRVPVLSDFSQYKLIGIVLYIKLIRFNNRLYHESFSIHGVVLLESFKLFLINRPNVNILNLLPMQF